MLPFWPCSISIENRICGKAGIKGNDENQGIAQSRWSDLVRGEWYKFSVEMLITLEARIGRKVRVEFGFGG